MNSMTYDETKQYELDRRYIRMAAIWAENSYCKRRQGGALIVKDKMIISDGYNGIRRVVYSEKYRLADGIELLRKAGIEVVYVNPKE